MKIIDTIIPDIKIIEPTVYEDERGWFTESWNQGEFERLISERKFVQDNHSLSHKGVMRGLHYQMAPNEQGKLVRVVTGSVFDVAVDIRPESETFGKSVSVVLSEKNKLMLWIPEGFAHGFLALEDNTNFLYKTTAFYSKESERSIRWDSPELSIEWPITDELKINPKDFDAPYFDAGIIG